jgi:hypothetical protein
MLAVGCHRSHGASCERGPCARRKQPPRASWVFHHRPLLPCVWLSHSLSLPPSLSLFAIQTVTAVSKAASKVRYVVTSDDTIVVNGVVASVFSTGANR